MNYTEIIKKLEAMGVLFVEGLSNREIDEIQSRYNLIFPPDLKEFLSIALPISDGFVNWRDTSKENIEAIQNRLNWPLEGMLLDIEHNDFWCDCWGVKPGNLDAALQQCKEELKRAPKLIPICSHRYIPSEPNEVGNPVFSVHQTDIIYYGENLLSYLEIEFNIKEYTEIQFDSIKDIRFWSSLMG